MHELPDKNRENNDGTHRHPLHSADHWLAEGLVLMGAVGRLCPRRRQNPSTTTLRTTNVGRWVGLLVGFVAGYPP